MAYGPMTHMAEADKNVDWLASGPTGSVPQQLVDLAAQVNASPEVRMYVYLGAVLPDMREAAPSIAFETHSRPFAAHMLFNVAADDQRDPLYRAVALGYASHVCSDIAAQMFAVPLFAAGGGAGASDVLVDLYDDRPDGENELWTEGILEIYFGDVETLLAWYDYFQPDPPAPERVNGALDFWLNEAANFFGTGQIGDATAIRQEIHQTLQSVAQELTPERRDSLVGAFDLLREYNLGDVIIMAEGLGVLEELVPGGSEAELDRVELRRLTAATAFFGDPSHFDAYAAWLSDLGPTIFLDTAAGVPWLSNWPTWRAEPLAASTIQSLAGLAGVEFGARADVSVYDLSWHDADTSEEITSVDSTAVGIRIRLVVHVYPLAPMDRDLLVRIRKALPGADYLAGAVVAETRVPTGWSPFDMAGAPPFRIDLEAELNLDTMTFAEGLHGELAAPESTGQLATIFFTTSWEAFAAVETVDLSRPVYPLNFGTYSHWPRSLTVGSVLPDTTPPSAPQIEFDPPRLTERARTLHVTVTATDGESSVREYVVSLGTFEGGADVLDATRVVARGSQREGHLSFEAPTSLIRTRGELHITAAAINHAGLQGPAAWAGPVKFVMESPGCGCRTRTGAAGTAPDLFVWVILFLAALGSRPKRRALWRD